MTRLFTALLILILLSACTPAPTAAPTLTATVTLPPPTATNVPPTPTVTPVPTQSPEQAADALGLRSEPLYGGRGFEYREAGGAMYLVDGYNDVPKAVLQEDGTWRKLDYTNPGDAELMYGDLVPEGGEYIIPDLMYSSSGPVGRALKMRFLGDWETEVVDYRGQGITLYSVLAGLRDGGGRLHVARIVLDAPDFLVEHVTHIQCIEDQERLPGNGVSELHAFTWTEDMLAQLRVGATMGMIVGEPVWLEPFEFRPSDVEYNGEVLPEFNEAQRVLASGLYADMPGRFQLTPAEKTALEQYAWPDRTVTLIDRDGFSIYVSSESDCPVYHFK